MTSVSVKEAKNRLSQLTRLAEKGETVVITRNGKPVADIVPHKKKQGGLNFEALEEYKKKHGITHFVGAIPPGFDDPLPEDFLLRPLPE
jgi:prevent-host-death family protein